MGVSESEDEPLGEDPVVDEQDLMADGAFVPSHLNRQNIRFGADDDEDGSVEDTDEEEEDVAAYEDDGFVVDEEEEEESDNSTESKSKKTKRKGKKRKPKDLHLDEDDYNLLEENNAVCDSDVCWDICYSVVWGALGAPSCQGRSSFDKRRCRRSGTFGSAANERDAQWSLFLLMSEKV